MPLYQNSLIYKLVHKNDQDNENIYVGSTTNFRGRKLQHKENSYYESSKAYNFKVYQFIRENGGWDEWEMVAVETYPCKSKRELEIRERFHIETLKSKLNTHIPTRTKKEHYQDNREKIIEQNKQHYQDNREKFSEQKKQHYQDNREKRLEQKKQYYQDNREIKLEQQKQYNQDNREKISEKHKEKITCECGCISSIYHITRHRKTDKHKKNMEALAN